MAGTHDDAVLVVELAKWGAMSGFGEALGDIFADDFDPSGATINDPPVRIVLNFFETVATLVKNDVLNRELVYDWLWVAGPWDRLLYSAWSWRLTELPTAGTRLVTRMKKDHRWANPAAGPSST